MFPSLKFMLQYALFTSPDIDNCRFVFYPLSLFDWEFEVNRPPDSSRTVSYTNDLLPET